MFYSRILDIINTIRDYEVGNLSSDKIKQGMDLAFRNTEDVKKFQLELRKFNTQFGNLLNDKLTELEHIETTQTTNDQEDPSNWLDTRTFLSKLKNPTITSTQSVVNRCKAGRYKCKQTDGGRWLVHISELN